MKTVVVLGGSYDPCHPAHIESLICAIDALGADEGWLSFSLNPEKDPNNYASLHHRMEIGRIVAAQYPGHPFVMTDIEEELGTHLTLEVMTGLKERFPDHRFIWLMGADNLATFHTWDRHEEFIENHAIAVLDRHGYTDKALNGVTARTYPHLKAADPRALAENGKGWCFIDNSAPPMSSRNLRKELLDGVRQFDKKFQKAADYIVEHRLYGLDKIIKDHAPVSAPPPTPLAKPNIPKLNT